MLVLTLSLLALTPASALETISLDPARQFQTIESFGTSGCWWSQYAGLWDMPFEDSGMSVRDQIAVWLFDREQGIGLTGYRFNLGAGSADSRKGTYQDEYRRTRNFEVAPGEYDFGRDPGATWFLERAAELGVREVVLFCNSPLERLTISGTAQMTKGSKKTNIRPENYGPWAQYCLDVAEHFLSLGIPVRYLSPINEPQWDWLEGNQEGCHFEPKQAADVYLAFLNELERRPALASVELSGPEGGEWGGNTGKYVDALLKNARLSRHMSAIDCHSYWSSTKDKESFASWMQRRYPGRALRMSEWCEMVNGPDVGMSSALELARTLSEDLSILNVVSWSSWVAVAPGDYHDGLMYASEDADGQVSLTALKRLWAFGNYARYIRPGYVKIDTQGPKDLCAVSFLGEEDGKQKLIVVLVNQKLSSQDVTLSGIPAAMHADFLSETSADMDLLETPLSGAQRDFTLPPRSVITLVFSD
ncbi:MAG: xylanase [Clostridia bacterium]|nr:xylanase [Clostridia bacterium]